MHPLSFLCYLPCAEMQETCPCLPARPQQGFATRRAPGEPKQALALPNYTRFLFVSSPKFIPYLHCRLVVDNLTRAHLPSSDKSAEHMGVPVPAHSGQCFLKAQACWELMVYIKNVTPVLLMAKCYRLYHEGLDLFTMKPL